MPAPRVIGSYSGHGTGLCDLCRGWIQSVQSAALHKCGVTHVEGVSLGAILGSQIPPAPFGKGGSELPPTSSPLL